MAKRPVTTMAMDLRTGTSLLMSANRRETLADAGDRFQGGN